jgi:HPt (histidine-containing phosphotransfer) domain-containing protein
VDEVFDEAELLNTVQGDRALLAELGTLFLTDSPMQVTAVRDAIARNDAPSLRFAAHAIKGSAATLTARRVAARAHELEKIGASGNLAGAAEGLANMEAALAELRQRLIAAGSG